jgi:beta-lactamase superfamily II metal-dependent hydrolase
VSGTQGGNVGWIAAGAGLVIAAGLLLGGCGKTTTEPQETTPQFRSVLDSLGGRTVYWHTDQPTRGAVRYGFVRGEYDHLAYPVARGDADKAYTLTHAVSLLAPDDSVTVYFRRTDRLADGPLYAAAEESSLVVAAAPLGPTLSYTTIDVQFGDAHVLRLPTTGAVVAIDGGDPGVRLYGETAPEHVMRWIDDHGITRLDVVLATHMHADHVGGLLRDGDGGDGLLERYPVGLYVDVPAVTGNAYNLNDVHAILTAKGIPDRIVTPGLTSATAPDALGWDPNVDVMVLNAGTQPEWADGDINNDSVVLKINYGDVAFITGGDCLELGESRILTHYASALAGVEYYKAQHHGRYNANSLAYLQAIAPRVSVIPIAFAAYEEGPAGGLAATTQTISRLTNLGADIFRFDSAEPLERPEDDVTFWHTTFVTDGASFEIRIEPSVWGLQGERNAEPTR